METGLRSARSCVQVLRFQPKTAVTLDHSQPAPARPHLVMVGIEQSHTTPLWVRDGCLELSFVWFWLLSPPAGDQKNSIIRWLSRSNTNFSAPKISSSKAHRLFLLPSSCLIVLILPQASFHSLFTVSGHSSTALTHIPRFPPHYLLTFLEGKLRFVVWDDIWRFKDCGLIGFSGMRFLLILQSGSRGGIENE